MIWNCGYTAGFVLKRQKGKMTVNPGKDDAPQCVTACGDGVSAPLARSVETSRYAQTRERHRTPLTRLHDTKGLSVVETVCIIGISIFGVLFLILLFTYMLGYMQRGDDANAVNTAVGVAQANSAGPCLVNDCDGTDASGHASHFSSDGLNRAYFDRQTNSLVATPPSGYNESADPTVDGITCYGDPGTLVIEVTAGSNGGISSSWVPGR